MGASKVMLTEINSTIVFRYTASANKYSVIGIFFTPGAGILRFYEDG